MTGARILLTAARQLKRNGGRHALVTLCSASRLRDDPRNPDAADPPFKGMVPSSTRVPTSIRRRPAPAT